MVVERLARASAPFVLAFTGGAAASAVSPAKTHGLQTAGDYLEHRYGPAVRGIVSVLVTFGCLWILAAQLMAGAAILNVITGAPRWLGSLVGGGIMTVYFAAGGLLGTAWVNTLQLIVMLAGFAVALPFALDAFIVCTVNTATRPCHNDTIDCFNHTCTCCAKQSNAAGADATHASC